MSEEKQQLCEVCGDPMPEGESMFKFHGYSGPCPKPPLVKEPTLPVTEMIRKWAEDRNLVRGATPAAQFQKLGEEFGELGRALIENDPVKFIDAVGDMYVVLTILAAQKGAMIEDCIASAYHEIKDRKGKMVDGIFVKEAE